MIVHRPLGFELRHRHHERMSSLLADADVDLQSAVDSVRGYGLGEGRAWFAGLRLDHRHASLIIFRVPDGGFDQRVRNLVGPTVSVSFQDAAHARTELEAMRDRVWELPGSEDIAGVSVPIDGSTVKVILDGNAIAAQAWMNVTFPGLVSVSALAKWTTATQAVA